MAFSLANFFEALQEDPNFLSDAENVVATVATGEGGLSKIIAASAALMTLVGHAQNSIVTLEGGSTAAPVTTTSAATGAVTTVTTSTTPPA